MAVEVAMPRPWLIRPLPPRGLIWETYLVLVPFSFRGRRCGAAGLASAVTQGRDLRWRRALQGSGGCLPAGISHWDAAMRAYETTRLRCMHAQGATG